METMIHNFDPKTGEYIDEAPAQLDPIDQQPMIPAYATVLKPPAATEGFVVVFRDAEGKVPKRSEDGNWEVVADNRGQYWNSENEPVFITELGVSVPVDWSSEKPQALIEQEEIDASGINPVAFMMRLSVEEQLWIEQNAATDSTAAVVLYRIDDAKLTTVQLKHPNTVELVTASVAAMARGLPISDQAARVAEILDMSDTGEERLISTSDFKNRFSAVETGVLLQVREQNAAIDLILRRIDDPRLTRLDLNSASMQAAAGAVVQALVQAGVVTDESARLAELLA